MLIPEHGPSQEQLISSQKELDLTFLQNAGISLKPCHKENKTWKEEAVTLL